VRLLLATAEDKTATATAAAALDVLSLALDGAVSAPRAAAEALRAAGAKEALLAVVSSAKSPPLLERARELLSRLCA
jgi:hypothetical protein